MTEISGYEEAGDWVVFDRVKFNISAHFESLGEDNCARLMAAASKASGKRLFVKTNGPLRFELALPIDESVSFHPTYALHAYDTENGLVLTGGSMIEMNLQLPLRQRHRIAESLIGLDRKRNFSKPTAELDETDVDFQFACIRAAADGLLGLIFSLSPDAVLIRGEATLSGGEVCHDLLMENAEEVVRATCRVPMAGTRSSWQQTFDCSTGQGRMPTWHFNSSKNGPVLKGYLKAPGLTRTECACPRREQVVTCVGRRSNAPLSADGFVTLAAEFYHAAGKLCCEALDHVRAVARGHRTQVDLRRALQPLHSVADGHRTAGGYTPSTASQRVAERILDELYVTGLAVTAGLRKGTKVRNLLEYLVQPGGPLVRGATNGIYCVSPEFGIGAARASEDRLAAGALAGSSVVEDLS